jgi:proteasome lid subunit RPN8/RPN11
MPEMHVHRTRPLPIAPLQGKFVVAADVIHSTQRALLSFAIDGIYDGGHEGLVYWAGRECGDVTVLTTAIVPDADHGPQRVEVSTRAVAAMSRSARSLGLGILSQVHSHPGDDTRHSDGDDSLILMPFEGMLSIVVGDFGRAWSDLTTAGVHQFQKKRWVLCPPESISRQITVVPSCVDLRSP